MVDSANNTLREVHVAGKGRLLTPDEAEFLLQCVLESEPVVVPGQATKRGSKKGPVGVPHLPRPKRLVE